MSTTLKNLEHAFAGECMAYAKYRYFAEACRSAGDDAAADLFDHTADQELVHAFGHLELLLSEEQLTPRRCLELAIEGETDEYRRMYPEFRAMAEAEGNHGAAAEFSAQISESEDHAERFRAVLNAAARRFDALTRVEAKHAQQYWAQLKQTMA